MRRHDRIACLVPLTGAGRLVARTEAYSPDFRDMLLADDLRSSSRPSHPVSMIPSISGDLNDIHRAE